MHKTETAGQQVSRGISVLAPACPLWWAKGPRAIDPHAIDLTDPEHAGILARVYGSHAEGLRLLHIPPELAPEYGFAACSPAHADALKRMWLASIIYARAEHESRPPPGRTPS